MEKAVEAMCRLKKNFWHLNDKYNDRFGQQAHAAHTVQTNIIWSCTWISLKMEVKQY